MLYQEVRPKTLDQIVGNRAVVEGLKKMLAEKPTKRPHTFLLFGPSGCGKTTIARILAHEFGCDAMSITDMNAANLRGIDSVREVANGALSSPLFGNAKCYIIDESQQLTNAAQQAFLKVIEDCPQYVYFIFCTTDPSKIIDTIKNRCAKYQVMNLRPSEVETLVRQVLAKEKLTFSDEVITGIVTASSGCPRQAVMLIEQIKGIENPVEVLEYLATSEIGAKSVIDLCRELVTKSIKRWENCVKLYAKIDSDEESIRLAALGYFKKVMLSAKTLEDAGRMAELISIFEKPTYSGGAATLVRMIFQACLVD